ncbi:MAG TPA: methyltransferase domain-containing protein [Acidobacteriota bacterium]
MHFFLDAFIVSGREKILDVGGVPEFWNDIPVIERVTLLNLQAFPDSDRIHSVCYGGGCFPFVDAEFDVVFSNSTLEHVLGLENQKLFAAEARRVGKGYFIQTPSLLFPFDPHALLPFFNFLPRSLKKVYLHLCHRSFYPDRELLDIRLLSRRSLQRLFPDGKIAVERLCGWPKSYVVYKRKESVE